MQCLNCNDEIISKNPRQKYCHAEKTKVCSVCNQDFIYKCEKHIKTYCSKSCAAKSSERKEKIKETTLKNHGVTNILLKPEIREKATTSSASPETQKRREATYMKKYGTTNPMLNPEIAAKVLKTQKEKYGTLGFNTDKQKQTMRERYGTEIPAQNSEIAEKIRQTQIKNHGKFAFNTEKQTETMIRLYGGKGRLSSPEEMKKQIDTMLERYGVRTPCEYDEFKLKAQETLIKKNGSIFNNSIISKINKQFADKLEALGIEVVFEKEIDGKFFDLFLPEYNILIEINPTITHNSTISFACIRNACKEECNHKPLSRNYHYEKSIIAKNNNMVLIQKFDWDNDDEIIEMIYEKTRKDVRKYSARKLSLKRIAQNEANIFLEENHIQKKSSKQIYCYGLFNGTELLAVTTFTKSRFNKNFEWEFCRYAVKKGVRVHGAHNMMFKQFINDVNPSNVISYVDFNHTTRNKVFLTDLGFVETKDTGPSLVWDKLRGKSHRITQNALNKLGADRLLNTNYGSLESSGMNNEDIMLSEGFVKVFTSGNRVFVWENVLLN